MVGRCDLEGRCGGWHSQGGNEKYIESALAMSGSPRSGIATAQTASLLSSPALE